MPRRSKQNKNVKKVGGRRVLRSKLREVGEKKVKSVVRYLLGSLIVFLLSLVFFFVAGSPFWQTFFQLLMILSGFVSIAFLLVLLILLFMKFF